MQPAVMVMGDYANRDWRTEKPDWGPVGSWFWAGWDELEANPGLIETYLSKAAALGKTVALSVMLYPDLNRDCTPKRVYAMMGYTSGRVIAASGTTATVTCPRWGEPIWEQEYARFVEGLAARYDGDPRIHSIWICTGIYGETVTSKNGYEVGGYWFRRWVVRTLDNYRAAWTKTPVMLICTGTPDRRYYAEECAARAIGVKFNALQPDAKNAVLPKSGGGLAEIADDLMSVVPFGYEHAYAETPEQTYWAMLYLLTFGGRVLDLPVAHLDALAKLEMPNESMWQFVLRMMDDGALFVARDTEFPTGDWEHGWNGPYERGLKLTDGVLELGGRGSDLLKAAPDALKTYVSAYGIGKFDGTLEFRATWQAPYVKVCAIVAGAVTLRYGGKIAVVPPDDHGWAFLEIEGDYTDVVELESVGPAHLHALWMQTAEKPQPPEPPTPTATLEERVKALEAKAAKYDLLMGAVKAVLYAEG